MNVLTVLLLSFFVDKVNAADIIITSQWQTENTSKLGFSGGQLTYSSTLIGNVLVPPYYYLMVGNYAGRDVQMVTDIGGSSHDGTWVQAPRMSIAKQSGWYYDGPFLGAVMDTLWLPQTLKAIGRGGFEDGTAKVVICAAATPPTFEAFNYNIYNSDTLSDFFLLILFLFFFSFPSSSSMLGKLISLILS